MKTMSVDLEFGFTQNNQTNSQKNRHRNLDLVNPGLVK